MEKVFQNMKKHNNNLSKYACNDELAIRLKEINEDFRTPFFRDIDKIIYSSAYSRYTDKTQVFSFEDNDMISNRMTHIQLVSKIARTIGRGLGLNEDLIEAASLGHDLGHVPFGHEGERILNKLSLKYKEGFFNHNVQSVRTLLSIENSGKGNNVSVQVLDAILCHNGEELKSNYTPRNKTVEQFLNEYNSCYKEKETLSKLQSMTLEGCVVRISDVIAYVGKDIEDAIRLNKIKRVDIPRDVVEVLSDNNSDLIDTIVLDIIQNSMDKNCITMSPRIFEALQKLINFNYQNIYLKSYTKDQLNKISKMFESLFDLYYKQIIEKEINEDIFNVFLNTMSKEYFDTTTPARKVIDYLAGMTDDFFVAQYKKYFLV